MIRKAIHRDSVNWRRILVPMIMVSLFGGKNVPQAVIGIGPPVGALRMPADDTLPRQLLVGWRICPSTRAAEPITVEQMVARAASQGSTG